MAKITVEFRGPDGKRRRLFLSEMETLRGLVESECRRPLDDDDLDRERNLADVLEGPFVRAVAHPMVGNRDIFHVFLRTKDEDVPSLFACVVITMARLDEMLMKSPFVVEDFSLQVAPVERLSTEGMRAAIQAWIERNFPDIVPPAVALDIWTSPTGVSFDELHLLLDSAGGDLPADVGEAEVVPNAEIADPPYVQEAA